MTHYDAIIIGAGQSGWPLARDFTRSGWKTALIEADKVGGTCVNYGCTPTKTLIASSNAIHKARRGDEFGFHVGGPITVDMKLVKDRVHRRVLNSRTGIEKSLQALDGLDLIYGYGGITDKNAVLVNGQEHTTDHLVINTGTRNANPPIPGLDEVPYMTNREILDLDYVPEHLIVLGGSYIGLEFAQAFRRFGSEVTIIEMMPYFIAREDEDVSTAVQGIMEKEGIKVYTNTRTTRFENRGDRIVAHIEHEDGEVIGTDLLVATGRRPNSDIGIENAGIETNDRGYIIVNDRLETNVPGIYATGEVNGHGAFTHTSYHDYEILMNVLFGDDTRRLSERFMTYALFTDPPLGRVGMTERQAVAAGHNVLVGKRPMAHIGRAIDKGETEGFMKFVIDAETERFLGAVVLGVGGDEIIGSVTNLMYADVPYTVFKNAVHIHPTVTELIPTTLADLKSSEIAETVNG
jgi:pyruvate/2-oxoglutarate dehydrogenase complex dihydrolipoamide dehydrogenase (E3) component